MRNQYLIRWLCWCETVSKVQPPCWHFCFSSVRKLFVGTAIKIVAVYVISGVRWSCLYCPLFCPWSFSYPISKEEFIFSFLTVYLDCLSTAALCVIALLLTVTHSKGSACFWVRFSFCLSGSPIPNLHLSSLWRQSKLEEKYTSFWREVDATEGSRKDRLEDNEGL